MFFWGDNFNLDNSEHSDLDIFLYDSKKLIHIATAGLANINLLSESDFNVISNFKKVLSYRRVFNFESISNIENERDNLSDTESYLYFFELMAKRGFYSYDRVKIDDINDCTFQLIAKPHYNKKIILNNQINFGETDSQVSSNFDLTIVKSKLDFPDNYIPFDIREYL